eukprot:767956-Hanusia_phi.AAC.6
MSKKWSHTSKPTTAAAISHARFNTQRHNSTNSLLLGSLLALPSSLPLSFTPCACIPHGLRGPVLLTRWYGLIPGITRPSQTTELKACKAQQIQVAAGNEKT